MLAILIFSTYMTRDTKPTGPQDPQHHLRADSPAEYVQDDSEDSSSDFQLPEYY